MCERIAIIDKGRILLSGKTKDLQSKLQASQNFTIRVNNDLEKALSIAKSMDFVTTAEEEIDSIRVTIEDPVGNNSTLMLSLLSEGVQIIEFAEQEATLEDLYLDVIKGGVT